eukprot:391983_1
MDQEQRSKLISDVKQLQKLIRNLEKMSARIGKANDTVSWRKTLNRDLQKGIDLVSSLQTTTSRIRADSIDSQDDKLLQQSDPIMTRFNGLKDTIQGNLLQYEATNDNTFNVTDDIGGGNADFAYQPPAQQQQSQEQLEQIGLVSMSADIDRLEEQNRAVVKIAEDVVELKEAFTDLNVLVEEQGDMITHVEQNTEQTVDQVKAGTANIETAEKHQVAARKKQLYLFCCCLVILIIVFSSL